ncbi:MAG: hypothetical protein K9M94_12980 [Spirochaetia bacterium]|nr:hypothetical protein [Spirochaetia bacterium]
MGGRKWTVEQHPKRDEIEKALIEGKSQRSISGQYGVPKTSIQRYVNHRFVDLAADAIRERQLDRGEAIIDRIHNIIKQLEKLINATDEWLTDPEDDTKYNLFPRADEVEIIYYTYNADGKPQRNKKKLQRLIEDIEGSGKNVDQLQWKNADIRQLLPRVADSLHKQLDLVAKILGEVKEKQGGDTYNFIQVIEQAHKERNAGDS